MVRFNLLVGIILGLVLPWNQELGLVGATAASFLLLFLALLYYLLGGRLTSLRFLQAYWTPREQVKDWFLYFSISTGVAGIVATVLSVIVPPLLALSLSLFIPLAFDSLSVLSALLELTIFVPLYNNIFGLAYGFIVKGKDELGVERRYIEDIDFGAITNHTAHTKFEVRDAMELLVRRGFAIKQSPTPLGKVRFVINDHGLKYLQACWNEFYVSLQRDKDGVEKLLLYLENRLHTGSESEIRHKGQVEAKSLRVRVREMREIYGALLDDRWQEEMVQRLHKLETRLLEQRSPEADTRSQ